jgi:hypothetical protein
VVDVEILRALGGTVDDRSATAPDEAMVEVDPDHGPDGGQAAESAPLCRTAARRQAFD